MNSKKNNYSILESKGTFSIGMGFLVFIIGLLYLTSSGFAAEIHVCPAGCTYSSIQLAVDAASSGDVIKVAAGVYTDIHTRAGDKQVVYINKDIILQGGFSSTNWVTPNLSANVTIIDAQNKERVIFVYGARPIIEGFTITGGKSDKSGGGIYIDSANPVIEQNIIKGNTASLAGGGLYINVSNAQINNNHIVGNKANWGGGIRIRDSETIFKGNRIDNNTAVFSGGGISIGGCGNKTVSIYDNLILNNSNGGIAILGASVELVNNIFVGNQDGNSETLYFYGGKSSPANITLYHNTLVGGKAKGDAVSSWGNVTASFVNNIICRHSKGIVNNDAANSSITADYTLFNKNGIDYTNGVTSTNERHGDPAFVNDTSSNYHIKSSSKARDRGTSLNIFADIDGQKRPQGKGFDIGADEYETNKMNLYFPHIASNTTWETEICIINTSKMSNLSGTIKAYNDSGTLVSSKLLNLKTNGRKSFIVGSDFVQPSKIGYIVFESNSASIYGYTKFHVTGKYRVAVPATYRVNTKDIYIPHIASNNRWWTGLSLVNTTSSAKTLTIEFDNKTTKTIFLAPNAHKQFTLGSLFSGVSQPEIKSGVIKNASGVIGLELFGSNPGTGKNYLSGILLKDETTRDMYYPHVASNTIWWTGVVAYNPAASSTDLTITPYKKDGTKLAIKTIILQSKEKYMGTPGTLNLPKGTDWFHLSADKAITGFELFGTNNGKQLAGYTGVNLNRETGIFPKLEKTGWTGIVFVNIRSTVALVTIKAFNNSGTIIATKVLKLNAHEKIVGVPESLFATTLLNAAYITYSSTSDIVGFQLNGSTDGFLLDALPGN